MQVKNKNFLITLLSLFLCLLAVITSLWTTPIKVFAEEEYVWVDLKVGDTIANKKLRIHGNAGVIDDVPSSSVIFMLDDVLKVYHTDTDPICFEYCGSGNVISFSLNDLFGPDGAISCEQVEDDPDGGFGGIWEYGIPSSIPAQEIYYEDVGGGEMFEMYRSVTFSLEGLKVTYVQTENTDYGVKIQVLMDKEEAVASGRYKVPGDFTLWGITVPVFGVGIVSIICLFALRKVKQSKRSKVYRGN